MTMKKKPAADKQRSINDRPLFMQRGENHTLSAATVDTEMEISNFRRALPQFLAVSVKNILLFVYGMTLGFPTIVIPAIQGGDAGRREPSDIVLNRDEISWFSSINLICVPLGCIFSGILTQPIGKRRAMQIVNLPILASWLLFHFSTRTEHLYAALCLSGLGGGLMEAPVLTYVAEITEPAYRGTLSALGSTCVMTGVFITFIFGSLLDWRTIAAVSCSFPILCIIALCFVPESPTWLISKRRFHEAVQALQWLRGWVPEHMIEAEFNRLYEQLITAPALEEAELNAREHTKPNKWRSRLRMFRKRSFLAPFLLVAFAFFAGHFSGKTPLQTYAVQIFHTLKAPINKYHATILLGSAELIATFGVVFLIHLTGKRFLVMFSTIGVGICFFGTAYYAYYLKVVPGFAVNNVVVNASSIVPKESIISLENITNIFENEKQKALQMEGANSTSAFLLSPALDALTTTVSGNNVSRTRRQAGMNAEQRILTNVTLPLPDLTTSSPFEADDGSEKIISDAAPTPSTPSNKKELVNVVNELLLPVPQQERNYLVWIPLVLLLGAAFFAHSGIRMLPWILIGEVFPAPVRSTASGLVSGLGYIFGFLANKLFLQMLSGLTMPGTFWFYSAVAFTGTIVLYFTLPETEGRTLAEIEAHFSKKSDVNLLRNPRPINNHHHEQTPKKLTSSPQQPLEIHMDSFRDLHIPISSRTEDKILQLQQSDFLSHATAPHSQQKECGGVVNLAFRDINNTTHL